MVELGRRDPEPVRRRGFAPIRDLPPLLWLAAVVVVALLHSEVAAPRWLMIHLLLLGAVTHSILVWSQYFADALLHVVVTARAGRIRLLRLALLNVGVIAVLIGVSIARWSLTLAGAIAVALAVVWHVLGLVQQLRGALRSRFAATLRYYIAAGALLPIGITFGVLMARGVDDSWSERLMLAHVAVNVFGWMGLTVLGTLVTLWPTMLRTRIVEGAEQAAARAFPVLLAGIVMALAGCLVDVRPLAGLGLLGYAGGVAILLVPVALTARAKKPMHFPTWSVLAALVWLILAVAVLGVGTAVAPTWGAAHSLLTDLTPALAVGFGAQVLLGALSYLLPVTIGGGPNAVRASNTVMDRGSSFRIVAVNVGLPIALLPVSNAVRNAVEVVILATLAAFIPLVLLALREGHRDRSTPDVPSGADRPRGPRAPTDQVRPRGQLSGLAAAAVGVLVMAVAIGIAIDPAGLARGGTSSATNGVHPTGATTHVVVKAANMRFTPDSVTVPLGNKLVIEVRNTDHSQVHDLVLDSGADSGRLSPGQAATVRVGVVGRSISGWCSVPGHRQLGMVFAVHVSGQPAAPTPSSMPSGMSMPMPTPTTPVTSARQNLSSPDLPAAAKERVHHYTLRVSDVRREVAPGVVQTLWTYNGKTPGPTLHGKVGDTFVIKLINDGDMAHSIDFHAGDVAPDRVMRDISPGASLTYRFTAHYSGIWLYHCSTMPMSAHIANGMFGAVVIDPPGLSRVAKEYLLVQSEYYLGANGASVDVDKVNADKPDYVVFNGYADQYDHSPLTARAGDRVRIWVLDAGPNRSSSFHVVGIPFDTVYSEGAYLLRRNNRLHGGSQVLELGPAQGGFVEFTVHHQGHYPFVDHLMIDGERGAHGILHVTR